MAKTIHKDRVIGSDNAHLLGVTGSRDQLETPCLVVDMAALESNIIAASELAGTSGKAFWPHLKAHKCVEIAKLQKLAGAAGFCVASIGEAEVFADAGFDQILITSTFCTARQIDRVISLVEQGVHLAVVVDNTDLLDRLSVQASERRLSLDVLVDIDMGRERAGCSTIEQAVELAIGILKSKYLNFTGLQAYAGQLSHMKSFPEREQLALDCERRAMKFKNALSTATKIPGLRCSGGSTGSFMHDIHNHALTEVQWGSYLFMDEEYTAIEYGQVSGNPFSQSLFVASRVISSNSKNHVTMDAGDKRFASKYGVLPRPARGVAKNSTFRSVSDEHGCLISQPLLKFGSIVELAVPHSDPTINLFDVIHVVRDEVLIDIWAVDARGIY